MADVLTKGVEIPTRYIDAMKIPYHFDLNAELWANKDEIDKVPTVSPDEVRGVCISNPSEGVWLPVSDKIGDCLYKCSQCGFVRDAYILDVGNYCPNCGARMGGVQDALS